MSLRPGNLYRVCSRLYADSQAVLNLAGRHDVVEHPGGWRVLAAGGAVVCAAVEGRPTLPGQCGNLYALTAEGDVLLRERCTTWAHQGLMKPAGRFESWPGLPASACGHACACGPCRARHGGPRTP
jgi:hypothetical protein